MPDIYIVQSGQGSVNAPDVMLINGGSGKAFRELPLPNTTVGRGDAVTTIPKWNSTGRAAFLVTNGRLKHLTVRSFIYPLQFLLSIALQGSR